MWSIFITCSYCHILSSLLSKVLLHKSYIVSKLDKGNLANELNTFSVKILFLWVACYLGKFKLEYSHLSLSQYVLNTIIIVLWISNYAINPSKFLSFFISFYFIVPSPNFNFNTIFVNFIRTRTFTIYSFLGTCKHFFLNNYLSEK